MSDKIHPLDAIRALEESSALKAYIEALDREKDQAITWLANAQVRIEVLEADKARLSEALRPFADMADYLDSETEGFADTDEFDLLYEDHLFHHFKVADFRDARAALSGSGSVATHRHKKRGNEYVLLGYGRMQSEWWKEEEPYPPGSMSSVDMREVAIYRSIDDGLLWARPREEFNDGRFEPLPSVLSDEVTR